MLTDKRRTELSVIPMLCLHVVLNGADEPDHPETKECLAAFYSASEEAVAGLLPAARGKILRRSERLHREVLLPYTRAGATVSKTGLIVFYLLQGLVDDGTLIVGEQSAMQRGLDILLPALEPALEAPGVQASAEKQARRLRAHLGDLGYFL